MISFKKKLYAACFGIGISISLSAWAAPGCYECGNMYEMCAAGDATACFSYNRMACDVYYPECTSI